MDLSSTTSPIPLSASWQYARITQYQYVYAVRRTKFHLSNVDREAEIGPRGPFVRFAPNRGRHLLEAPRSRGAEELGLEGGKEAFHGGVVEAVAFA